ncbi:MAG: hypothetical protein CMJ18_24225 [Phycisphaeraceae bacterium]|nr:hypothetical protein [Phycisphaeraceae bacterium]
MRKLPAVYERLHFAVIALLVAGAVHAEIPPLDLWTEKTIEPWSAGAMSRDRAGIGISTNQLVGNRAIELTAQPGESPITFSLSLGRPWDLRDADQLVFAWRILDGSFDARELPHVNVWAKNEIGEGFSRYRSLAIEGEWRHLRLDLNRPDEQDEQYGAASRRGIERIEFVLPARDRPLRILVDDLHFETSAALILERARALGPLKDRIRPERYARFLCGDYLPAARRPALEAKYAPHSPIPETPHRKWGTPLSRGPLRALFVVNLAFHREVIELGQRLDMRYDFVPLLLVQRYKTELLEDLARKRYDVVVTSRLEPNAQMQPFTDWLTGQVARGTGWIAINSSGTAGDLSLPFARIDRDPVVEDRWKRSADHPILDGVPLAAMPPFQTRQYDPADDGEIVIARGEHGHPKLAVSTHGKGRVVGICSGFGNSGFSILPVPTGRVHVGQHFPYWEYEYAMLAKAMLWAAHRAPDVRVTHPRRVTLRRGVDDRLELTLTADRDFAGTVESAWQRLDGVHHGRATTDVRISAGLTAPVSIDLPAGSPRGLNLLDLTIRDIQGRVESWLTVTVDLEDDLAIGRITGVRADPYRHGDAIEVTADLEGTIRAGAVIQFEVVDTWDRVITRTTRSAQRRVEARIPVDERFLTDVHDLRVMLSDREGAVDVALRRIHTPIEASEKHRTWWVGATAGGTHLHPHLYRHVADVIRSADVSTIMTNGRHQPDQAHLITDAGLWVTPENIIWTGHWNKRFPAGIRTPCLSDPKLQDELHRQTVDFAAGFRRFGPIGYSSMEEHSLCTSRPNGTVCKGPHCRVRFSAWLRGRFADLDALNVQWETQFASWDEVEPLRWEDGASRLDNPSRWIDFRLFMESVYTDMQRRFNDSIRGADAGAYVGYNCGIYGENPFAGMNRAEMGRVSSFSIEYQPSRLEDQGVTTTMELLLGAAPHVRAGYYVGYKYMDFEPHRYWFKAWWQALRQQYGPFYYTVLNDASTIASHDYVKIHPSLAENGFTPEIRATTRALTRGVGRLLLEADRRIDVAVYHSQASMMRRYYDHHRFPQEYELSRWDVRKHIREADYDYRRLVEQQLTRQGTKQIKVILLADCMALTEEEWRGIERFVDDGGVAIAFARTGFADGHGRFRSESRGLARLFGVRPAREAFKWRQADLVGTTSDELVGVVATVAACDPVREAGADVLARFEDGEGAIYSRRVGPGRALFCNFSHRFEPTERNVRMVDALLTLAGAERTCSIEHEGRRAGGFQSFRYQQGPIELVGLLQTMGASHEPKTPLTLTLSRSGHVHDLLSRAYLGQADRIDLGAPGAGRPAIFATLPYAIESVAIDSDDTAQRGARHAFSVAIHAGGAKVGDHVVRLEIFDPFGRPVTVHTRNVTTKAGRFEGVIPFALNDPAGGWTVSARDVITGKEATATVNLK